MHRTILRPLITGILLGASAPACGQGGDSAGYHFYRGYPYGSQGNYHPLNVIINGGYGIWQVSPNCEGRMLFKTPYRRWWGNTWRNIRNPAATVRRFGVKRFISTEVFPTSLDLNNGQYLPNYFLHVVGAGMHSRATEEWFRFRGVSHPRLWSVATMAAYHLLSETIENNGNQSLSVDAVADLYLFDPAGILLFTNDRVCRFFSQKLNLAEWSLQPAYNVRTGRLENMGQSYAIKVPFTRDGRWRFFGHMGLHGMAGISGKADSVRSFSAAGGLIVEDLRLARQDGAGKALTASATWCAGLFYDRNNSLMASLYASGVPHNRFRLNFYPGLVSAGGFSPGFFTAYTGEWVTGLSVRWVPMGAAAGF